jgi:hypothetical protein
MLVDIRLNTSFFIVIRRPLAGTLFSGMIRDDNKMVLESYIHVSRVGQAFVWSRIVFYVPGDLL